MIRNERLMAFVSSADHRRLAIALGALLAVVAAVLGIALAVIGPVYTVALLIALVGAVWVIAGLQNALLSIVLIIALLPYSALPFKIVVTPTFLDMAMAAFFFLYLGQWMTGERRRLIATPVHPLLVLFILLSIFSFVIGLRYAGPTSTVLRQFAEFVLSMTFALVLVDVLRGIDDLRPLVLVLLGAGAVTALLGIGFWLLPDSLAESILRQLSVIGYPSSGIIQYIEQNPELPERAIGTAANPNSLGGFLVMIAALAAPQALTRQPIVGKQWHAVTVLGLLGICLILTFSRGSMFAFAVALAFIAALRYRKLLWVMIGAGLLVLILPWTQFYVQRVIEGLQGADLATQMRFGEYRDALTLIGRYPLLGVGFAGTPDVDIYLGVANVYLTIASSMGLLGLASFLLLMAAIFLYAWRAAQFTDLVPGLRPILLGLVAGLIGALANGLFDHYFFNIGFHPAVTILWTFVGMTLAASRIAIEAGEEQARADRFVPIE